MLKHWSSEIKEYWLVSLAIKENNHNSKKKQKCLAFIIYFGENYPKKPLHFFLRLRKLSLKSVQIGDGTIIYICIFFFFFLPKIIRKINRMFLSLSSLELQMSTIQTRTTLYNFLPLTYIVHIAQADSNFTCSAMLNRSWTVRVWYTHIFSHLSSIMLLSNSVHSKHLCTNLWAMFI